MKQTMKPILMLAGLSIAMVASAMELRPLMIGQPIPDVGLKTAEGKTFDLQAAAGPAGCGRGTAAGYHLLPWRLVSVLQCPFGTVAGSRAEAA